MNILIAPALGVFGLIAAFVVFSLVMRYSDGTDQVKKIGDEIHKGAMKFMKTEYTYLLIFVAVLVVLVATFLTIQSAIAVIVGAACSSLAGFIGMYAATKANVRTATAAQQDGAAAAKIAPSDLWPERAQAVRFRMAAVVAASRAPQDGVPCAACRRFPMCQCRTTAATRRRDTIVYRIIFTGLSSPVRRAPGARAITLHPHLVLHL